MAVKNTLILYASDKQLMALIKSISSDVGMDLILEENGRQLASIVDVVSSAIIMIDASVEDPCIIDTLDLLASVKSPYPIVIIGDCEEKVLISLERIGNLRGLTVFGVHKKDFSLDKFREVGKLIDRKSSFVNIEQIAKAIEGNEFLVFYQPKIAVQTNKLVGLEALIRWKRPMHGLVLPDAFIPLAEKSGLIVPLTYWVIREVCKQYAIWKRKKIVLKLAINLTPSLLTDLLFPDEMSKMCAEYQVNPADICFEITEAAAMHKPNIVLEVLTRIRLKNFSLSIDDFGTGYSSLVELQRLPFNELKIDRSFVFDLGINALNSNIVKSVIALGKNMQLTLVAEGVETKIALEELKRLGCDVIQGHYIAPAMSVTDFGLWYKQKIDANGIYKE